MIFFGLFIFLFHSPIYAIETNRQPYFEITGEPEVVACSRLFLEGRLGLVDGERPIHVSVGTLQSIVPFVSPFLNFAIGSNLNSLIEFILQSEKVNNNVIDNIRRRYDSTILNESELVLCLLKGECRITGGRRFLTGRMDPDPISTQRPFFILLSPLPAQPAKLIEWLSGFFAAFNEYADSILLRDWIAANQQLRANGQKTDKLFEHYVRTNSQRRRVNSNFILFMKTTRGVVARLAVIQSLLTRNDSVSNQVQAALVDDGLAKLRFLRLARFALPGERSATAANLVDLGLAIGQQMEQTVQRAARTQF
jgi:hypothetical protein